MTSSASAEPTAILQTRRKVPADRFAHRHPFVYWFLLLVLSNVAATVFNFAYNLALIVDRLMDGQQQPVFWWTALIYNLSAYAVAIPLLGWLIAPLIRSLRRLQAGETVSAVELEFCRRRAINLPIIQLVVNLLSWLPAAIIFPAIVCGLGGTHEAREIWTRFVLSFVLSACYATAQTFFLMEWFLVAVLYPDLFRDARPAEVRGGVRIRFGWRMLGLWLAVGVMPLAAVTAMACYSEPGQQLATLIVALVGLISGLGIFSLVRSDIEHWMAAHAAATEAIARENFAVRVVEQRPDEWGRLTDHFNDMAAALGQAEVMRDTFGQFVNPEVRDDILKRYPGLQVSVQEITVLFVDIRGFTLRCAGEDPERVGDLLNRFLTLVVGAVEDKGGYVNKFLGDGVLALFGATHHEENHADLAVTCAREMLTRLAGLNDELTRTGQAPLVVGIGIHTGPALVGCFGATLASVNGPPRIRREFSAIGETVNLGQRIEQMTKQLGGPILLSEATHARLHGAHSAVDLGPQALPGAPEPVRLYQLRDSP